MNPEGQARVNIDKLLEQSGWLVQDYKETVKYFVSK